uniref:Uncharacterized protein n=1 Tax=Attheya septentrionalis TaxID=420275 RepID=A0A7S2UL65_9STRA
MRFTVKDLIANGQLGWVISLVSSVIYLVRLLTTPTSLECDYSSDGFCVTNLKLNPGSPSTCPHGNSHLWAWREDAIFTVLAVVLGIMTQAKQTAIVSNVAVILVHGLLHKYFDDANCIIAEQKGLALLFANIAYAGFTALLSYVALNQADLGKALTVIGTIAVTLVTSHLSQPAQGYGVSPIFMTTQLLVSFLGVTTPLGNAKMGYLFALPCIVSIIELRFCCDGGDPGFFNKIGGHAWYDFFLHIAVLSSYFPDDKPKIEGKVE